MPTTTYNDGLISRELQQLGFREVSEEVAFRIIACTTAPEKSGKTHWAFTAPGPIGAISTDTGTEEIAKKFLKDKRIIMCPFQSTKEVVETAKPEEQRRHWKRMKESYTSLVENRKIRTIIWDTATEAWELCRLAAFGKLTQVLPHHYTEVNSEFTALVKQAYQRKDLNVIFIHKQKKEYKTNSKGVDAWSGKWTRSGFGDMPYLVDINLVQYFNRELKVFGIEVLDSRIEMCSVVGLQMEDVLCTFEELALQLFPGTEDSGLWRG